MDSVVATGLNALFDLLRKYRHNPLSRFFQRRRCYYFYIPVGLEEFLANTKHRDLINIVKLEEVISALLPETELNTFYKCLENVYKPTDHQIEPYLSIAKKTLQNVVDHYVSLTNDNRKILFVCKKFDHFNLIKDSKKKIILLPTDKVIEELLPVESNDVQLSIVKKIFSLSRDHICTTIFFEDILTIDAIVKKQLKVKSK